ncbi:MAG: hypothetical protein R2874_12700 [Desulfobacterales bacterium]
MFKLHFDLYSTQAEAFMAVLSPLLPDTELGRDAQKLDGIPRPLPACSIVSINNCIGMCLVNMDLARLVDHIQTHTGLFNDFYINFDRFCCPKRRTGFGGTTSGVPLFRQVAESIDRCAAKMGEIRQVIMKNILLMGKLPKFWV